MVGVGRWLGIVSAVFFALVVGAGTARAQGGDVQEKIERLFREGVDLFEQAEYKRARLMFTKVLELDPTEKEAQRLVEEAGTKIFIQMMTKPAIGPAPAVIWKLYRRAYRKSLRDDERIRQLVAKVTDPNVHEVVRWRIIQQLEEIGQFAIPHLMPFLMNAKDEEPRSLARVAATKIGSRAVLAMIELLEHPVKLMRENAALILGDIQPSDHRAVAPLKALAERERNGSTTVLKYADRSLEKILGLRINEIKSAREYYYLKADRYYREVPSVPLEAEDADGVIWHLTKGEKPQLKYNQVPFYAWNELMAEQACYDLFEVSPAYDISIPLFASVMAAQYAEVKDLIDVSLERPTGRPLSEEEVLEIRDRDLLLRDATLLIHSAGPVYLYRAIGKALREGQSGSNRDKYAGVLAVLIDAVKDVDPTGDLLPGNPPVKIRSSGRARSSFTGAAGREAPDLDALEEADEMERIEFEEEMERATLIDGGQVVIEGESREGSLFGKAGGRGGREAREGSMFGRGGGGSALKPTRRSLKKKRREKKRPTRTTGKKRAAGRPLIQALYDEDKRIQYAAAIAVATMNPPRKFEGSERVVRLLASAIGESGPLQLLLIEEDQAVRNAMRAKLAAFGYEITLASEGREGMAKAVRFPPKDLIIVGNDLSQNLTPLLLLKELAGDPRTRYTPTAILSITQRHEEDKNKFPGYELLHRDATGPDLKNPIERLASWEHTRALPIVNKLHAEEVSVAAANALLKIDPYRTWMTPAHATRALVKALKRRSDDVRNPCARALGQFKLQAGLQALVDVFNDKDNSLELRANCLWAVGQIAPDQAYDRFRKVQQEEKDFLLRYNAAEAYGKGSPLYGTAIPFLQENRIQKKLKEE